MRSLGGAAKAPLLEKSYTKDGDTQGGKMFWGGAFAMKSAIRQSSYDAYKKVFADLRQDLKAALDSRTLQGGQASPPSEAAGAP